MSRVPIGGKEALPTLHASKIEVSLTLGLGNLGPQALPAHLALKSKMLAEVGPGESVQVLQTGKQDLIRAGQARRENGREQGQQEVTEVPGLALGRWRDGCRQLFPLPLTFKFHRS